MAYAAVPSAQDLIARADKLAADRAVLDSNLEQVRELFYPTAPKFTGKGTPGEKVHEKVFDSTPENAGEFLAAGLQSLLTNPGTIWFDLSTLDKDLMKNEGVARWLESARDGMLADFNSPKSNFTPQQHEKYMELVTFGTGVMYIADRPAKSILFSSRPLAECTIAESDEGLVDTLYRRFTLTARQAVQQWGEAVPEKVGKASADPKKQDTEFKFLHCTEPRPGPHGAARDRKPFASYYVAIDEKVVMQVGGYDEFPYTVPRWSKRAGEVYGRGPGMKTLADARMLQRMMKTTIRGAEKIVDPSLLVADDGVLSPVRVMPAGKTYVRWDTMQGAGAPVRPLQTGGRPELGLELIERTRKSIQEGNYNDLFKFARDPNMKATVYLGILDQVMQALNPIIGRMQVEDLGQLIDRVFAIKFRRGDFDAPPPELEGQPLKVEYVSPVAKTQRVSAVRGLGQWMELWAPMAQAKPEIMDLLDEQPAMRDSADLLGLSKTWLRSADKIAAMAAERTRVQEAAARAAGAQQTAETLATGAKGAKALSDAMGGAAMNGPAAAPPQPMGAAA